MLALGVMPAGASAAGGPAFVPFRDRVLKGPVASSAATARSSSDSYRTPSGLRVRVTLSASYPPSPSSRALAQQVVDFLDSRVHGSELSRLNVFIGTPSEIRVACGGEEGVLACYSRAEARMYVPASDPEGGGPYTREYAVTHEYGHHIANFRSHYPFPALDYGPKYWSSYEHVCSGVSERRYFPGDQGRYYLRDPGEGWADAYAHLHYPDVVWQYVASLRPDAGAFAAIRRDVLSPWRGPARRVVRGRLTSRQRARAFGQRFSLDGMLDFRLHGPRGSSFDLELRLGGRRIALTRTPGSGDHLRALACRRRSTTANAVLRVIGRRGTGRFTVVAGYPG
jgi:hypothetical protein